MKKIILSLLCFTASYSFSQFSIGLTGGYNSSKFFESGSVPSQYGISTSAISSFNAGVLAEIKLSGQFFLQPALLYYANGSAVLSSSFLSSNTSYSNTTIRANYLRLPVNVVYKLFISDQFNALGGAGLYVARGLSGTEKGYQYSNGDFPPYLTDSIQVNNKVQFTNGSASGENTTALKPMDFGYDVLLGVEYHSFELTANYSRGLLKADTNPAFDYNFKNNTLAISVAYLFSLKKEAKSKQP